ncbi:MAG: cyanoexosortase B [Desertifilum sp.]|nr:cyanoexosortase B [Desertifilum sp.]
MTTEKLKPNFPLTEQTLLLSAIAFLLLALYAPVLAHWYDGWLNKSISIEHEYFSHGLIGIPFAAYIAWTKRHRWQQLANRSHLLGGILIGLGGIFYLSGLPHFVNLSFPAILSGICLWLKGIPGFRLMGFPLLLVFLATPTDVPYLIEPYALPLQSFIANIAGFILSSLGMDVTVEQIYLFVGGRVVEVAPHCAGLKMLFTSLYVSLMLLYWSGAIASRRKTSLLLGGAALISVTANIIRNTLLTYFHGTGNAALFDWLHESWGGDLYSAGMLGLIVVLLNVIDREDEEWDDEAEADKLESEQS